MKRAEQGDLMIVVLEGIDASGKGTQATRLAERLGATQFKFPSAATETGKAIYAHLGQEWHCTAKPEVELSHLDGGETLRRWIEKNANARLNALVFQSLQTVNRLEILPELTSAHRRGPVVLDRYWQSAVVYGGLEGLDPKWLRSVQERPMPTATAHLLLDVPIEESIRRRPERRDRYEQNRDFMERGRKAYLHLWGAESIVQPPATIGTAAHRWRVIDAVGTEDEVAERIWSTLQRVLECCGTAWPVPQAM